MNTSAPSETSASALVLELAVFEAAEPDAFPAVARATHEHLCTIAGFVTGVGLRSEGTSCRFADAIVWRSFEHARLAGEQVRADPRFAPMMASIRKLSLYAHYRLVRDPSAVLRALTREPLIEIAAYPVRDQQTQRSLQPALHAALPAHEGFGASSWGQQLEDEQGFLDLAGWRSRAAHERASAALMAQPALAPLFHGIVELTVFDLFVVQA